MRHVACSTTPAQKLIIELHLPFEELQPSGWMGVALQVSTSLQAVEQRTGTCPRILTSYDHSEPPRNASILIQRRDLGQVACEGVAEWRCGGRGA